MQAEMHDSGDLIKTLISIKSDLQNIKTGYECHANLDMSKLGHAHV